MQAVIMQAIAILIGCCYHRLGACWRACVHVYVSLRVLVCVCAHACLFAGNGECLVLFVCRVGKHFAGLFLLAQREVDALHAITIWAIPT